MVETWGMIHLEAKFLSSGEPETKQVGWFQNTVVGQPQDRHCRSKRGRLERRKRGWRGSQIECKILQGKFHYILRLKNNPFFEFDNLPSGPMAVGSGPISSVFWWPHPWGTRRGQPCPLTTRVGAPPSEIKEETALTFGTIVGVEYWSLNCLWDDIYLLKNKVCLQPHSSIV